jgi:TolB-like protein
MRRGELSILLTLAVLGAVGTYRIATGIEPEPGVPNDASLTSPAGDATLASAPEPDLGRRSVAVLPFRNNVSDPDLAWIGSGLADLLTTNFAQIPDMRVVGRQSLYDLLTEEGRTETEEIPEALANTVARAAGARLMVWGTVTGTPDDLAIDAQLIELENGTVVAGERVRGTDVFEMVDSLTMRLSRHLGGDRRTGQRIAISELGTRDLEALAAFQAGVQAERAGRPEEAAELYERAVEIDTAFALPAIRLAGGGDRWRPPAPSGEVDLDQMEDVVDLERLGAVVGIDLEGNDWSELDEETRAEVRVQIMEARRESAEAEAELHRARAMRMLERIGGDLAVKLQGMSPEDFIFKFDSTLGRVLSDVTVIVTDTASDTVRGPGL